MTGRRVAVDRIVRLDDCLIEVCGIGAERAAAAAERLVAAGACSLASVGTCAGIDPMLRCGDFILPGTISSEHLELTPDDRWRSRLAACLDARFVVHRGGLANTAALLCSPQDKRALAERSGALAADMESLAIGTVAKQHGLPFVTLRVVLDEAAAGVPAWITRLSDVYGRARLLPILSRLCSDRRAAAALLALARGAGTALRRLGTLRDTTGLGLCGG